MIERKKPGRRPEWTPAQLEVLEKLFSSTSNSELALILSKLGKPKTESAIRNRIMRLKKRTDEEKAGLSKENWNWTETERDYLRSNHKTMTTKEMADALGRSYWGTTAAIRKWVLNWTVGDLRPGKPLEKFLQEHKAMPLTLVHKYQLTYQDIPCLAWFTRSEGIDRLKISPADQRSDIGAGPAQSVELTFPLD